jgi:hypothetical protein
MSTVTELRLTSLVASKTGHRLTWLIQEQEDSKFDNWVAKACFANVSAVVFRSLLILKIHECVLLEWLMNVSVKYLILQSGGFVWSSSLRKWTTSLQSDKKVVFLNLSFSLTIAASASAAAPAIKTECTPIDFLDRLNLCIDKENTKTSCSRGQRLVVRCSGGISVAAYSRDQSRQADGEPVHHWVGARYPMRSVCACHGTIHTWSGCGPYRSMFVRLGIVGWLLVSNVQSCLSACIVDSYTL